METGNWKLETGKSKNLQSIILILCVTILLLAGCAEREPRVLPDISASKLTYEEGSLWPKEAEGLFLFKDTKAKKVGDIITVHIVEKVNTENNATTKSGRESDISMNTKLGDDSQSYILGGGTKFRGTGGTTRGSSLKTTLTAMVIEVLNNGNLKIDGVKELTVNDDKQYVKITGIVRPEDISRNNSVLSTSIAEVHITYEGEGLLDTQNPGWLAGLMDYIWPF